MSNNKQIKDYLHYYIRCFGTLEKVTDDYLLKEYESGEWVLSGSLYQEIMVFDHEFRPHLRPLSSMTEDDLRLWAKRCVELGYKDAGKATDEDFTYAANRVRRKGLKGLDFGNAPEFVPESISFLLKQGFDLFGLIEAELAIDKTKMK